MLLAIDVGNTSISFGVFDRGKLKRKWQVATCNFLAYPGEEKLAGCEVVISSVVPAADKKLKQIFPGAKFIKAANIKGLPLKIKNKNEVGADRAVNAYAASVFYGKPLIVIDFGTATTFDIVSKTGAYLGGAISPGIRLAADVLHEKTAKLPRINIHLPKKLIGDSTESAMASGIVFGYAALVEGMIRRFKKELGAKTKVVATGGYARLIAKFAEGIDIINMDLTLKGLNLLCQKPCLPAGRN